MPLKTFSTLFPWRCSRCTITSLRKPHTLRPFSTTLHHPQETSPTSQPSPESPRFMPPPSSKQATYTPPSRVRGILPVPRNILSARKGGSHGYDDAYFDKTTRSPAKPPRLNAEAYPGDPKVAERNAWRARLAAQRRENLQQGVAELRARRRTKRRVNYSRSVENMSAKVRRERAFDGMLDEKLTRPTIPVSLRGHLATARQPTADGKAIGEGTEDGDKRLSRKEAKAMMKRKGTWLSPLKRAVKRKMEKEHGFDPFAATQREGSVTSSSQKIPDPNREQRVAEMQARVEEKEARKRADRQDALHTLYMNARSFITNESQLDAALDDAFGTEQEPKTWGYHGTSVWHVERGSPFQGIADKMRKNTGKAGDTTGFAHETNQRLKRIAEELTGGKM